MTMRQRYCTAPSFGTFLETVLANGDLWHAVARRATVPDTLVARAEAVEGRWHVLVLVEDWCGDAVNTLPAIAKLADTARNMDLRVLGRDANPDLMDAHLSGQSRAIPVVILYDENFQERGWWGSRPEALQRWVMADGEALSKTDRYREIRSWYARDRGITTLTEIVGLMEGARDARAAA